jgi:mono/diheme cytochrome c family protein
MSRLLKIAKAATVVGATWSAVAAAAANRRRRAAFSRIYARSMEIGKYRRTWLALLIGFAIFAGIASTLIYLAVRSKDAGPSLVAAAFRDEQLAKAPGLMIRYGCAGCHIISGVPGAEGQVGPPLRRFGARVYIAGKMPNGTANLVRWLINPASIDPHTAMPITGINEAEARLVAAYLLEE